MSRRGGRILLLLSLVVAIIAGALFIVDREQRLDRLHSDITTIEAVARSVEALAFEARAGQQAYVAAGQGEGFWASQVEAATQDLSQRLENLRGLLISPTAQAAIGSAEDQLARLGEVDRRALEYVKIDQRLMASDLVFTDGLGLSRGIVEQARLAAVRERETREAARADLRRTQAWALVFLGLVAIAVCAGLAFRSDRGGLESVVADSTSRSSMLDDLLTTRPSAVPAAAASGAEPGSGPIDLGAVADLCTDFARVIDPGELPNLLERSARLIGATGLIVWMVDSSGARLKPALAHGYSPQALAMMGTLARDADNATAEAFRNSKAQTVPASGTGLAALVTPLISASGCVGAMAAEVPAGHEARPPVQALASIVAAQLASLVAAPGTTAADAGTPAESATR